MALSWVLRDPRVTSALIGASRPEQILENVKAAKNTFFSTWEIAHLDSILEKVKMPPSPWASEAPDRVPVVTETPAPPSDDDRDHHHWKPVGNGRYLMIDYSQIGYCTNVHAGVDLETTRANLEKYALAVKRRVSPDAPMGVGLWLSANAAANLMQNQGTEVFAAWLREVGLIPYTFNGFPYGDFHQTVVKHRVYEPTWWEPERLNYTLNLIDIQDAILPKGMAGSISTMPIAWGNPVPTQNQLKAASANLHRVAERLQQLERETGRYICLCLEPEPGCYLQRSADVVRFFHEYLLRGLDVTVVWRYIKVCHDVCHAVVMFESQDDVFRTYQSNKIGVGKIQLSSAVCTPDLFAVSPKNCEAALAQLASFREERYLHQTCVRSSPETEPAFFEDLPLALAAGAIGGEWRVHFHVPIYLEKFGHLLASREAILECLHAARRYSDVKHIEVETYAWGVLPPELQQPDLAAGIADELKWYIGVLETLARESE